MEVFKILWWCCIAVTIAARRPHGTALHSTLSNVPHEQCYCIPQSVSGIRVTDMQIPQKERLIVYLYKDVYGQVTLHIPNHKRQVHLPDLPVDTDDIFEGNVTYTVNDLFRSNMSHILLQEDNFQSYIDRDPSVDHHYNVFMPSKPKITSTSSLFPQINLEYPGSSKHNGHRDVGSDGNKIPLDHIHVNNLYSPITSNDPGAPDKRNHLHLMEMINKNTPDAPSWLTGKPTNVHLSDVTGPKGHINNILSGGLHTLQPGHILGQPNNLPSVLNQAMEVPDHYLQNIPHIKFDQWLTLQMNILNNHKSYAKFAVDINTLRGLLLKTLQNNGIRISNAGFLIDSKGNRIKIEHLKLNPVLLGDPLEYEKRFAAKGCLTQYELPHIETVLLSSSNPPRILGIIPLGNALLTSSSSQTIPICSQSNHRPGSRCRHLSLMGSNENGPFNHNIVLNSLYRRNGDDMENLDVPTVTSDGRRSDDSSEPEEIIELRNDDEKSSDSEDDVNTLEEIDISDDTEDIGIRVLGGQSATSSGAPLNNKGRSGII